MNLTRTIFTVMLTAVGVWHPTNAAWNMLFRMTAGGGAVSPSDLWLSYLDYNPLVVALKTTADTPLGVFKASDIDLNWSSFTQAKVAFYTGGVEVAYVRFSTTGTTKNNFFAAGKVIGSIYSDMTSVPSDYNHFILKSPATRPRRFYISKSWSGICTGDLAWLMVQDLTSLGSPTCSCLYDITTIAASPKFLYSNKPDPSIFGMKIVAQPSSTDFEEANVFVIYAK